jgi:glycerophosphoryl diester phosphodiesterase
MTDLEKKKERKKQYNNAYLEKLRNTHSNPEQKPDLKTDEKTENIRKIIQQEMNFFLKDNKTANQQTPIVIQAPPSNLKSKILETMAITSLGLIPLIFKHFLQPKSNVSQDTAPVVQSNLSQNRSTDMNYFS